MLSFIIIYIFRLFSSISDLFLARSLIFHFLSHERERDSICNVVQMCDTGKAHRFTFFPLVPAPVSGSRERKLAGSARARNRRHRAIMPGIQIADDSTGERNSMGSAGIDERSPGGLCMSVERRTGRRSCSSSVNDRVPDSAGSKFLISGWPKTPQRRDQKTLFAKDASTRRNICLGATTEYCADQSCRQWLKKEMRWLYRWGNDEEKGRKFLTSRAQSRICKMKFSRR